MAKAWRVRGVMGGDVCSFAGRATVRTRVREALSYEARTKDPDDVAGLHDMRIAVKRLRYCVELFRPYFGKRLKKRIKAMEHLQELLGFIHDCDVLVHYLRSKLPEADETQRPGVEGLLQRTLCRRAEAHTELCAELERLRDARFWRKVLSTMGAA